MTSRTRVAGLSKARRQTTSSPASTDSRGIRALAVLALTPALVFFMSRKDVGHAASRPTSTDRAQGRHMVQQWPSSGFEDMYRAAHPAWRPASLQYDDSQSANLIYARAMLVARKYDSRPYWRYQKLEVGVPTDRATADLAIEHLIPCESMGRTINRIDSNGKMSYGILQFQDWNEWEAASGLTGNPDNRHDAIRMAEWAIQNGMINHWGCAQILKMM
ncbi:MAG TPA: hypothetical protein VFW94_05790 [Candidatus Acidoferrales bacterium]|nr:hypothetical protein [Candidatus Acidoferrales bacterium]